MEGKGIPIKITKVSSNDSWPLVYLPKEAVERLGLKIGRRILIELDENKLVIRPLEAPTTAHT